MVDPADYIVFGLGLKSAIMLPDLAHATCGVTTDVVVELGRVPDAREPALDFEVSEDGALLSIKGIARYWIRNGSTIRVEREPGAPDSDVRLFLLGSAMGILLHQRGLLPLHANAIEIDGRAFAFMGRSGAGKSTLAAWFHDLGYPVIADDVCVVRCGEEGAFASPGIPRLRLWEEALTASGRSAADYALSYAGDERYRKFDVPLQVRPGAAERPLAAIYLLAEGDQFEIGKLRGAEAADAIFANTYRGAYVRHAGNPRAHWTACIKVVERIPIFRLARSRDLARLAEEVSHILAHARAGAETL